MKPWLIGLVASVGLSLAIDLSLLNGNDKATPQRSADSSVSIPANGSVSIPANGSVSIPANGAATDVILPADANVANVKQYGAKGDGKTDDTDAIQAAIQHNIHASNLLYFPNGTYLVSRTLEWRDAKGQWSGHLTLQGQSRDRTIIKLRDRTFTQSSGSLLPAVIRTASGHGHADGGGNQAFSNSIRNLTIDTGVANPAAVGIDYIANNQGSIRDVTIRSGDRQGLAGISMKRYGPGPLLIKHVLVDGFNYGIDVSQWEYSQTYEHITLQNQLKAGIHNTQNVLTIRNLQSHNAVPAIQSNDDSGMIVLLDSHLTGGLSNAAAVEFNGALYARNLSTDGYKAALKNHDRLINGTTQREFVSHPIQTLFGSSFHALNLPIQETPSEVVDNPSTWVKVQKLRGSKDDSAAIQQAIDSAARQQKKTVYFPNRTYKIGQTIFIHGSVQRLVGLESRLKIIRPLARSTNAVFRFENLTGQTIIVEGFFFPTSEVSCYLFEQASPIPLVLKDILAYGGNAYRNTTEQGSKAKLFIEDVAASGWSFSNQQQVWARQLNAEGRATKIVNNDATLWLLGIKTEGKGTVVETTNKGYTEILGGELYPLSATSLPAFINHESSVSLVYTETGNKNYATHVQETRDGVMKALTRTTTAKAGLPRGGKAITLYVGK